MAATGEQGTRSLASDSVEPSTGSIRAVPGILAEPQYIHGAELEGARARTTARIEGKAHACATPIYAPRSRGT